MPWYKNNRKHTKARKRPYKKSQRSTGSRPRIAKLVRSVMMKQLETKYIDTSLGSLAPDAADPAILPLNMPDVQGNAIDQRVGAYVDFVHLSAKLRVGYHNMGDIRAGGTLTAFILVLKNGMFSDDLVAAPSAYLFNPDFNGDYTPLSYTNQANWSNYFSIAKIHCTMSDLVPVAQIPHGLTSATGTLTDGTGSITNPNQAYMTESELYRQRQLRYKYYNINKRIRVRSQWGNLYNVLPAPENDSVTRNKFFIVVTTDLQSQEIPSGATPPTGRENDRIFLQGNCRLSYKDA